MNEGFVNWQMLLAYPTFVTIVWLIVEVTKDRLFIKKIKTKDWAFIVAFVMLIIVNIYFRKFQPPDLFIYAISALFIGMGSNGMSDRGLKKLE